MTGQIEDVLDGRSLLKQSAYVMAIRSLKVEEKLDDIEGILNSEE